MNPIHADEALTERNLRRLEALRPMMQHNPKLAAQLERSIVTVDRLRDTKRWIYHFPTSALFR